MIDIAAPTASELVANALRQVEDAMGALLGSNDPARFGRLARLNSIAQKLYQEGNVRVDAYIGEDEDGNDGSGGYIGGLTMSHPNPAVPHWNSVTRPEVRELMQVFGPMMNAQQDAQLRVQNAGELASLCDARKKLASAKQDVSAIDARIAVLKEGLAMTAAAVVPVDTGLVKPIRARSVLSSMQEG